MEKEIIRIVKDVIFQYPSKNYILYKDNNYYIKIKQFIYPPNIFYKKPFEKYYFIIKGFLNNINFITDGFLEVTNNIFILEKPLEIYNLKDLIYTLRSEEIEFIYKDLFQENEKDEIKMIKEILKKEKIFQTDYTMFGMIFI